MSRDLGLDRIRVRRLLLQRRSELQSGNDSIRLEAPAHAGDEGEQATALHDV